MSDYSQTSAAQPIGDCPRCGGTMYANLVHHCSSAVRFTVPGWNPPPAWKFCPHCLGSGMVSADDLRETKSPLERAS